MKITFRHTLLLSIFLSVAASINAQQKSSFQMPASFNFDYEVVQQVNGKNGQQTITYYYTTSGDYTALLPGGKEKGLIIYTKDGNMLFVDDQKKAITIMRFQGMMDNMTKIAEQYKKNNSSTTTPTDSSFKFEKTGNTKQIGSYTSEEYRYSDNKGQKGSIWYTKVDFNASSFFMMGKGSPASAAMGGRTQMPTGYPQIADPHQLMTEIASSAHPDEKLTTTSISKKSFSISTTGYTVTDLSSMMGR